MSVKNVGKVLKTFVVVVILRVVLLFNIRSNFFLEKLNVRKYIYELRK